MAWGSRCPALQRGSVPSVQGLCGNMPQEQENNPGQLNSCHQREFGLSMVQLQAVIITFINL